MNPVFTSLEELKPPTWSVFHKTGNEKEKEIKIMKDMRSGSPVNTKRQSRGTSVEHLETKEGISISPDSSTVSQVSEDDSVETAKTGDLAGNKHTGSQIS